MDLLVRLSDLFNSFSNSVYLFLTYPEGFSLFLLGFPVSINAQVQFMC